jgi:hypothetical protein
MPQRHASSPPDTEPFDLPTPAPSQSPSPSLSLDDVTDDDLPPEPPPDESPEPLSPSPDEVAAAAKDLNDASNDLGSTISAIETFLESRNIGVPAWVRVKGWRNPEGKYWDRELGYDRVGGVWHISIRERHGDERWPEDTVLDTWAFNSSPRKARISAVDKLPELLRELVKEAERTARRLREKSVEVKAFAAALNISITPKKIRK